MRQGPVILPSLLILPLAENCSRLKDRDAKCSLTLYFNSLLSLIRQTAFKFWLPIFRRLGHNLQNVPSQQNGPAGVMTLMPVIIRRILRLGKPQPFSSSISDPPSPSPLHHVAILNMLRSETKFKRFYKISKHVALNM